MDNEGNADHDGGHAVGGGENEVLEVSRVVFSQMAEHQRDSSIALRFWSDRVLRRFVRRSAIVAAFSGGNHVRLLAFIGNNSCGLGSG